MITNNINSTATAATARLTDMVFREDGYFLEVVNTKNSKEF